MKSTMKRLTKISAVRDKNQFKRRQKSSIFINRKRPEYKVFEPFSRF